MQNNTIILATFRSN